MDPVTSKQPHVQSKRVRFFMNSYIFLVGWKVIYISDYFRCIESTVNNGCEDTSNRQRKEDLRS